MRQVYDNITEKMFGHSPMRADEAPEGLILHSAHGLAVSSSYSSHVASMTKHRLP
jgi:hypothetical protein